jgi:hypothetical protein
MLAMATPDREIRDECPKVLARNIETDKQAHTNQVSFTEKELDRYSMNLLGVDEKTYTRLLAEAEAELRAEL